MLQTAVFIDNVASEGGGSYSFDLYFSQVSKGKFLAVGDYIQDTNSRIYEVTAITGASHVDGGSVTTDFVTADVAPTADSDYNSIAYTPGQVDVRPRARTEGIINSALLYDGPNYEYEIEAVWDSFAETEKIILSDSLVDFNGKEYELTFIDGVDRFNTTFRVKERVPEGITPALGVASMYSPTTSTELFQGTPISDPSRTVVRNRDNFLIDAKLTELENSISSGGSGSLVKSSYLNDTGTAIAGLTAVCSNASGEVSECDPSVEADVEAFLGITIASIGDGASGDVAKVGVLENITTSFSLKDSLFVAKDSTLTNTPPEIGVNGFAAGDFIIYIGHISVNEGNSSQKNLELRPQVIGQL